MDTISGSSGNDTLTGTTAAEAIFGGDGNDTLTGAAGNDELYGGKGTDTASYSGAYSSYTITPLYEGKNGALSGYSIAAISGTDGIDSVSSDVEYLKFSNGTYQLDSGTVSEIVSGSVSADHLSGTNIASVIDGGAGNDTLTGGLGADTFIVGSGSDTITDLGSGGTDILNVSAGATVIATLSSAWIASSSTYNKGTASINSPGLLVNMAAVVDGTAGFSIYNTSTTAASLTGSALSDLITGNLGDDTLTGGIGNDTLSGGSGSDLVYLQGKLSDYKISVVSRTGTGTISDSVSSRDGSDSLQGIEHIRFSDFDVNTLTKSIASSVTTATLQRVMELYVAFFNRTPDADGLSYWLNQTLAGSSINAIADAFYNVGVQYTSLTGFSPTMSNADFVNVVYRNVLGRSDGADAGGLAYWTGELASGNATRGSLVSTILDSAHTYKGDSTYGWVANLLDNKITVAKQVSVDWSLNYLTADASVTNGMAIAKAVTATDTSAAIALVGLPTDSITIN